MASPESIDRQVLIPSLPNRAVTVAPVFLRDLKFKSRKIRAAGERLRTVIRALRRAG